jgi:hypothetical protein
MIGNPLQHISGSKVFSGASVVWLLLWSLFLWCYCGLCRDAQAQQPPYIFFAPATGPVIQYKARVRTSDSTTIYLSNFPHEPVVAHVELGVLPDEPYWIDVAAVGSSGHTGEWGDYIPVTADLNESGMVTAGDFIILSREFGEPDRGGAMFLELVTHWGDVTKVDEAGVLAGVRRYEGE